MAHVPAVAQTVFGDRDFAWSSAQLRRGPVFRILHLYNWMLGVSGAVSLLFGKALGKQLAVLSKPEISRSIFQLFEAYIRELLVANLVLLGAVLVRGPWAHDVFGLLQELARRQSRRGTAALELRYTQGALLVARVTIVAPALMLAALLLAEHRLERFVWFGVTAAGVLVSIVLVSAVTGVLAVHVRRSFRKHALLVWFGLWLVPEVLRLMVPILPTPRSLIGATLDLMSFDWGFH